MMHLMMILLIDRYFCWAKIHKYGVGNSHNYPYLVLGVDEVFNNEIVVEYHKSDIRVHTV